MKKRHFRKGGYMKYYLNMENEDYDYIKSIGATNRYLREKRKGNTKAIADYIQGCEFEIIVNKDGTITLKDLQGGYLGGYETYDNFKTIIKASERLEGAFYKDYYNIYLD